jgi:hypothetical protein
MAEPPTLSTLSYDEMSVGQRWGPFTEVVSKELCDRLRGEVGAETPGATAPPGVIPVISLWSMRRAFQGIIPGGVLARQRFSTWIPLTPEDPIEVDVQVVDQRRRRSGLYSTLLFTMTQNEGLAAIAEWTILAPPSSAGPGSQRSEVR